MLGGIQRHFHDAFHFGVCGAQPANIHAQVPSGGRPDLIGMQCFALNVVAFS